MRGSHRGGGDTDTNDGGSTTTPTDDGGATSATVAAAASPSSPSAAARSGSGSGIGFSFGFGSFAHASSAQHHATHLAHAASPSLSGELLRQALSSFLRTQVAHVTQALVLRGFNGVDPSLSAAQQARLGSVPVQQGKLCYAVLTQCEVVLIDRAWIGGVRTTVTPQAAHDADAAAAAERAQSIPATVTSLTPPAPVSLCACVSLAGVQLSTSVIAPSYDEIMRQSQSGRQQMVMW